MAAQKISELTAFTDLSDTDTFVAVDGTVTKKITATSIATYMAAELTGFALVVNTNGNAGRTIYIGSVDPDVTYTPVLGDIWIDTA